MQTQCKGELAMSVLPGK